jgi:hypothetical protein
MINSDKIYIFEKMHTRSTRLSFCVVQNAKYLNMNISKFFG